MARLHCNFFVEIREEKRKNAIKVGITL